MAPSAFMTGGWPPRARRLAYELVTSRVPRRRGRVGRRRLLEATAVATILLVLLVLLELTVTRTSTSGAGLAMPPGDRARQFAEGVVAG